MFVFVQKSSREMCIITSYSSNNYFFSQVWIYRNSNLFVIVWIDKTILVGAYPLTFVSAPPIFHPDLTTIDSAVSHCTTQYEVRARVSEPEVGFRELGPSSIPDGPGNLHFQSTAAVAWMRRRVDRASTSSSRIAWDRSKDDGEQCIHVETEKMDKTEKDPRIRESATKFRFAPGWISSIVLARQYRRCFPLSRRPYGYGAQSGRIAGVRQSYVTTSGYTQSRRSSSISRVVPGDIVCMRGWYPLLMFLYNAL